MKRARKLWSESERRQLKLMWRRGDRIEAICAALGRSKTRVHAYAHKLGLKRRRETLWTPERLVEFHRLRALGYRPLRIAELMGLEGPQVIRRIHNERKNEETKNLAATVQRDTTARAMRRCLGGCNQMFESAWIGNRMCERCLERGHSNAALEPAGARF